MINEIDFEIWDEEIVFVAKKVSKDFPSIEYDDIYQQLWEFALTYGHLYDSQNCRGLLFRVATIYAWDERKEQLKSTCQYDYRTSDVRKMLETQFDHEDWELTYVPPDAKSTIIPTEPGAVWYTDQIELSSEIAWGLKRLKRRYKPYYDAILSRYGDGQVPLNASKDRKTLDRAILALTEILNFYDRTVEGIVGNRRIYTNTQSQHIIRKQWEI